MNTIDESSETPRRARKTKSTDGQETPETASAETADVAADETATAAEEATIDVAETAEAAEATDGTAAPAVEATFSTPDPEAERRRIREQLDQLERKQAELRRALAIAEHPALGEAIRVVEGRVYAVARAEAKMAQGLSKGEERRRETLEKKLTATRTKRDELDAQIAELERELAPLGVERTQAFEAERREALETLMGVISAHDAAFAAAGLELTTLVPELARFMPEIQAIAEQIVARGRV